MKFSLKTITKKKAVAVGLAFGVAAGAGGIAAAYFTNGGSGSSQALVGTPGTFTVVPQSSLLPLFPGGPHRTITFTIFNEGTGTQLVTIGATTAHVVASTATGHTATIAVSATGSGYVTGCKASWFTASSTPHKATLAHFGTTRDVVTVWMNNGTTTTSSYGATQDKCEAANPYFTLSFSR